MILKTSWYVVISLRFPALATSVALDHKAPKTHGFFFSIFVCANFSTVCPYPQLQYSTSEHLTVSSRLCNRLCVLCMCSQSKSKNTNKYFLWHGKQCDTAASLGFQ